MASGVHVTLSPRAMLVFDLNLVSADGCLPRSCQPSDFQGKPRENPFSHLISLFNQFLFHRNQFGKFVWIAFDFNYRQCTTCSRSIKMDSSDECAKVNSIQSKDCLLKSNVKVNRQLEARTKSVWFPLFTLICFTHTQWLTDWSEWESNIHGARCLLGGHSERVQ